MGGEGEGIEGRVGTLVIGGEALRGEHLRWWRHHAGQTRVVNEYGPTETVVGCCVYGIRADEMEDGAIGIGKPIANTRLYVLDEGMKLQPLGVAGDLYIGRRGGGARVSGASGVYGGAICAG